MVATAPTVAAVTVPTPRLRTMATADTPRLTTILHRLRITTQRPITRLRPLTAIAPVVAAVVAIMVAEAVAASTAVVAEVEASHMVAVVVADPMAVIINS